MTGKFTLKENFDLAREAVLKAGEIALKGLQTKDFKTWLKGGYEPVTEIDLKVNEYLKQALTQARPGYGWLSEESVDDRERLNLKYVWVVDPIDGTRALIKGRDDFTICVALVKDGKPVVGAIFSPARKELYLALEGAGATLNGKSIQVSRARVVEGMKLQGDEDYFDRPKRWQSPWRNVTYSKYQSFALRVVSVAAGEFDAAISARPKSEWDLAAADLIVTEAGGICCGQDGRPLTYNNENTRIARIVAANPALKDQILEKLKGRIPKNTS